MGWGQGRDLKDVKIKSWRLKSAFFPADISCILRFAIFVF
jgi:hypothetical protein